MSDSAPESDRRHSSAPGGRPARRLPAWVLAVVGVLVLGIAGAAVTVLRSPPAASPTGSLTSGPGGSPADTPAGSPISSPLGVLLPEAQLDRRWGSYLSEREWGNPREAIGNNGWGLTWSGAIGTEYRYGDDGIGGLTDLDNEFRIGWAFWDGRAEHVTERFRGATNPEGAAGEEITDDRVFLENTPRHSYQRLVYRYPSPTPSFAIQLESAKLDSSRLTMVATVTNLSAEAGTLHVVLKGWMAEGGEVDPLEGGLLLRGADSAVAVVGGPPTAWQISADRSALDVNLRTGVLAGDQGGHIGALSYSLTLPAGGEEVVRIGVAEESLPAALGEDGSGSKVAALAAGVLGQSAAVADARRLEANESFAPAVTQHAELYQQALSTLLWNESYYEWDGTTGVDERWAGRVDAAEVLIMPDKWEYPWVASWDSAFQAVTATLADGQVAQDQIRFLLSDRWQQPDGHIPCAEWVMGEECPPIFAWAAWRIYESTADRAFLQEVYAGLERQYDYWWQEKEVAEAGEALFTGGFLGMDNLPRALGGAQADATGWMALFARDMARIATELDDPAGAGRYEADNERIGAAINTHLWDPETGFYYDLTQSGRFLARRSYSGLIPLVAGVAPADRLPLILDALRDEGQFMSAAGIRSLSADSELYVPGTAGPGVNSNWRGPVWVPINYLLVGALAEVDPSLAADIRDRVVNTIEQDWQATRHFHEFFDGDTGAGLGADAQGWTALVANLIIEAWPAAP